MLHKPGSKGESYSPYIEIVEQECISVESAILNNRNANVHIVVKNTSFVLRLRSVDMSVVNFSTFHVKAGLYYANEPMKEVSFIQTPPITYVGSSCSTGEYFTLDVKISILSSQHQGNLFYLMLHTTDTAAKHAPGHVYLSHPIRVVSKVDHIKKDPNGMIEKKQTFIDILTERFSILERMYSSQQNILTSMYRDRDLEGGTAVAYDGDVKEEDSHNSPSHSRSSSPPSSPRDAQGKHLKRHKVKHHPDESSSSADQQMRVENGGGGTKKSRAEMFLDSFNKVINLYKEEYSAVDQSSGGHQDTKQAAPRSLQLASLFASLSTDEKSTLRDLLDAFTFDDTIVKHQQHQYQQQQHHQHQSPMYQSSTASSFNLASVNHETTHCGCPDCPYRKQAEQFMLLSPIMMPSPSPASVEILITPHDSPLISPDFAPVVSKHSLYELTMETITE
ncbi:hypothetical protein SAMD00019534_102230 [Acytostelium subglobosum LB1]|uniref:hypothetical protein n=1 Tax=Acytostelium subglobosum LB1 TaxID=1410327 RepID=UPI000644DD83|nr:hypothetical protein SAMD00019534_102230 [Acytostelium subglobosum LB1]GAM27048.1 hypothetical protein SAMD00019534_102230 [Acytostelium subglobosum LB1]|eukprot:XP_012749928.1 hypothetical protein SAMD00019534_102230 [Acytostelium subglobosum LB1]